MNVGRMGYSSSLAVSWRNETAERTTRFLVNHE